MKKKFKNIAYPVINKGIILDHGTGIKFVFRSFINMPLGWCYLYPLEKNEHVVNLEMEILNSEDRDMPVFFPAANKAFPVYWDKDGMPEVATAELNVFVGIIMKQLDLLEIDEEFIEDHDTMFCLFKRHFDDNQEQIAKEQSGL